MSHRVVDRFAVAAEHEVAGGAPRDGQDVEVHRRTEAAVQSDLLGAEVPTALDRAEVEERETDRLLELARIGAGEEHVRDVRLHVLDGRRPMGMKARVGETIRVKAPRGTMEFKILEIM